MIDIHSHLIFGMDDGAPTIEESIKMIQEAEKIGIDTIIATPHFQEKLFDVQGIYENYNQILAAAGTSKVNIKLGSEVFMNPFLLNVLKDETILFLNGSRYLLLELPYDAIPAYAFDLIHKLQLQNIKPIIAHPERNINLLNNFDVFLDFLEKDCLMQLDAGSIIGIYGKNSQRFAKKLIKMKMAHFVASDAHCAKDYEEWILPSYKKVCSWAGKEYADALYTHNPKLVLENTQEDIYQTI